jgi:hypothetical protein
MKVRLPFVGQKSEQAKTLEAEKLHRRCRSIPQETMKDKDKFLGVLGGLLDISRQPLSNEKTMLY